MKKSFLFAAVIAMVAVVATSCEKLKADFKPKADGLTVKFENTSKGADSFAWNFGDEATSTEKNPTHTYAAAGSYKVTLVASNGKESDKKELTIEVEGEGEFVKLIDVTDNSLADWDKVPEGYVFTEICPDDAQLLGLKSVKVCADAQYVYVLAEPDPETITDLAWVPFHIYLNTDNSDATGGYGDEFADANADVLIEGAVFGSETATTLEEAAISYAPATFKWWGEVGGSGWDFWTDPSTTHDATDKWGAIVGEGDLAECMSQFVDGKIEIQFMRELIPTDAGWNEDAFGIGFDIQQNWSSVGILPQVAATEAGGVGYAPKMTVRIKK